MAKFVAFRLLHALIVLAIVVVLIFVSLRLLPGDALLAAIQSSQVGVDAAEGLALLRAQYGLDISVPEQFIIWISNYLSGDWGESINFGEDVLEMFLSRLPVNLQLFLMASFWSFAIGIPVGIVAALKRNTTTDMVLTSSALIGYSIPDFFLGIVLIYTFAVLIPLFPTSGYVPIGVDFWANLHGMLLPSLVLGAASAGVLARYLRSSLLDVIRQDYIRTARAKGLGEPSVVFGHALRPAMIPVVTIVGLAWNSILAGSFIIEFVFALPGLGQMTVQAIYGQDFPVAQATIITIALNVLIVNFLVDILYGYLDPRVRVR